MNCDNDVINLRSDEHTLTHLLKEDKNERDTFTEICRTLSPMRVGRYHGVSGIGIVVASDVSLSDLNNALTPHNIVLKVVKRDERYTYYKAI